MCRRFDAHFTNGTAVYATNFRPPSTLSGACRCNVTLSLSLSFSASIPGEGAHSTFPGHELIQLADVIIIIPPFHAISCLSCSFTIQTFKVLFSAQSKLHLAAIQLDVLPLQHMPVNDVRNWFLCPFE